MWLHLFWQSTRGPLATVWIYQRLKSLMPNPFVTTWCLLENWHIQHHPHMLNREKFIHCSPLLHLFSLNSIHVSFYAIHTAFLHLSHHLLSPSPSLNARVLLCVIIIYAPTTDVKILDSTLSMTSDKEHLSTTLITITLLLYFEVRLK